MEPIKKKPSLNKEAMETIINDPNIEVNARILIGGILIDTNDLYQQAALIAEALEDTRLPKDSVAAQRLFLFAATCCCPDIPNLAQKKGVCLRFSALLPESSKQWKEAPFFWNEEEKNIFQLFAKDCKQSPKAPDQEVKSKGRNVCSTPTP